jgi:hypothetical protein
MTRRGFLGFLVLLMSAFVFNACDSGADSLQKLTDDMVAAMKDLNDEVDKIQTSADADAAAPRIKAITDRIRGADGRVAALRARKADSRVNPATEGQMNTESARMAAHSKRLQQLGIQSDAFAAAMQDFSQVMLNAGKAATGK